MIDPAQSDVAFAAGVIRGEAETLAALAAGLDASFDRAVGIVQRCAEAGGTVLISGLGKSGLIGAKVAATLSSLGVPSHAVHPTEAVHGDLGRFRPQDAAVCISHSGETQELVALASILRQDGLPVIAITRRRPNTPGSLERVATVTLDDATIAEAGEAMSPPLLAPTNSTTAALALGDALALTVARRMRFTNEAFAKRHPGGHLGGLLRPVAELLRFRAGDNLALIEPHEPVRAALAHAAGAGRRPGAIVVVEPETGRLAGIFTDGDLRRLVLRDAAALDGPIERVMTRSPRALPLSALARDAAAMIREHRQDEIPVVDDLGRPVGLLDVQDLVAMRLVAG